MESWNKCFRAACSVWLNKCADMNSLCSWIRPISRGVLSTEWVAFFSIIFFERNIYFIVHEKDLYTLQDTSLILQKWRWCGVTGFKIYSSQPRQVFFPSVTKNKVIMSEKMYSFYSKKKKLLVNNYFSEKPTFRFNKVESNCFFRRV